MIKKRIKIPIYLGEITIIQTSDLKDIEDKYNLTSLYGMEACCFSDPTEKGYTRYVLAFAEKCTPKIIAHESLHLVGLIFRERDIKMDMANDEPQCYLLEWIVDQCHKFLKVTY